MDYFPASFGGLVHNAGTKGRVKYELAHITHLWKFKRSREGSRLKAGCLGMLHRACGMKGK